MPLPVALAQVAIEFIGLVMITTKSHPVQALIPKVPVTSTVQSQTLTSTPIQHHRALLAVPKAAYIKEQSSWPDEHNLGVSGDYQEFELKDERLIIDTGIATSPITVGELGLPQLTHADGADLTTDFKPPFRGAEAVVDMPYGSLTACSAQTTSINRIDGLLKVDSNGRDPVVIRSTNSTTHKIAVDPRRLSLPILIANVPDRYATTGNTIGQTGPHWMVYYQMIQNPTQTAEPTTTAQMLPCPVPPPLLIIPGGDGHQHATQTSSMMMMPQAVQRAGTTAPTAARRPIAPAKRTTAPAPPSSQAITPNPDITTAECGSTQWP